MKTLISLKVNEYNTHHKFTLSETDTSLEITRLSIENGTHKTETLSIKTNPELQEYYTNIHTSNSTIWSLLVYIGVKRSDNFTLRSTPDFTVSTETLQVLFSNSTATVFDILPFLQPAGKTIKTTGHNIPLTNSISITGDYNSGAIVTVLDSIARFYTACPDGVVIIPWTNETYSPLNKSSINTYLPGTLIPVDRLQTKQLSSQRFIYTPLPYESEHAFPHIERSLPSDRPVLVVVDLMMIHDSIEKIRSLTRLANTTDNITVIVHTGDIGKVITAPVDFSTYIGFSQSATVPDSITDQTPGFDHTPVINEPESVSFSETPQPYDSQYNLQKYQPARISTDSKNWNIKKFPAGCIPTALIMNDRSYIPDEFGWKWAKME